MPKISELTAATTVGSGDTMVVVQAGATKRAPVSALTGWARGVVGSDDTLAVLGGTKTVDATTGKITITIPSSSGGGTGSDPNTIRPEDAGASVGTGGDDNAAMLAAMAKLGPRKRLVLSDSVTYRHSSVLTDLVSGVQANGYTIEGGGKLLATAASASALRLRGNDVTLRDFTKDKTPGTTRYDPYEAQNIVLDGCLNLELFDVCSMRGTGTGFFMTRIDGMEAHRLRVIDTLADGIHMTGGTKNAKVVDPRIWWAGDDGVAAVGYTGGSDPGQLQNIDVIRPVVLGSKAGRGVAALGVTNYRCYGGTIEDTFAAGVYVASETYGGNSVGAVNGVMIHDMKIRKANRNTDPNLVAGAVDHGAVLISTQVGTNTNITLERFDTYDTRPAAPWEVAVITSAGCTVSNVLLRDFRFHGRAGNTWYQGTASTGTATNVVRLLPWEKFGTTAATLA